MMHGTTNIKNTHFMCSKCYFSKNRAVYETVCKNIVESDRPRMTMWRMRIACWVPKATKTRSEYVVLTAFPLQQWLQERASTVRYTNVACIVRISNYDVHT